MLWKEKRGRRYAHVKVPLELDSLGNVVLAGVVRSRWIVLKALLEFGEEGVLHHVFVKLVLVHFKILVNSRLGRACAILTLLRHLGFGNLDGGDLYQKAKKEKKKGKIN